MRGPIDYIIVGFEGNNFTGEVLDELAKAVDAGVIAVLDLALISRGEDGDIQAVEITDPDGGDLGELGETLAIQGGLIGDDDVAEVGELLEDNTSAGLLIVEHLWAVGLKQALVDAGGFLLADGRIHPDAAAEMELKGE